MAPVDTLHVSPQELAREADNKFTEVRTEFFSNPPTEAGLSGVFQAGLKAVEAEATASQMGGLKDKKGKTLEAWADLYGKAIEAIDKGGHPELLTVATDQVAGMAINDAEEKLRAARKETRLTTHLNQALFVLDDALSGQLEETEDKNHNLLKRMWDGYKTSTDWGETISGVARRNLRQVQTNAHLTKDMVERKTANLQDPTL
ncbi:hypothetical protein L6272_00500 [Microgenomates group bacterium]|nr:hypothetical protein [Microgenomates group bacterium]